MLRGLEWKAQEILDEQVKKIEEAGETVAEAYLRIGRPDREIVTLAEEIGAGLIVVGSRGLGGIRRALMGSVSSSVVSHAHCPVLVVRREKDGGQIFSPKKILLATDGSEEAQLAAQTAADLARKMSSELQVVHARLMLPLIGYSSDETLTYSLEVDNAEEVKKRVMQWLNDQVEKIEAEGGKVTQAHLRPGRAEEGLITLAEKIVSWAEEIGVSVIVVGSRGLGGIKRALMGSVSDSVARHAHCPILVVRGDERFLRGKR